MLRIFCCVLQDVTMKQRSCSSAALQVDAAPVAANVWCLLATSVERCVELRRWVLVIALRHLQGEL